jgi:hypothetical protein
MKFIALMAASMALTAFAAHAQSTDEAPPSSSLAPGIAPASATPAPVTNTPSDVVLPVNTMVSIVPVNEISSMHMHVGDVEQLQVAADIMQNGIVVIPRGAPVKATVTWRTGKGIVGKSAKFILTFNSVNVRGHDWALKGTHRQEGRGNTLAALLGSSIVTGHSAVILSGQVLNAFTDQPIPVS